VRNRGLSPSTETPRKVSSRTPTVVVEFELRGDAEHRGLGHPWLAVDRLVVDEQLDSVPVEPGLEVNV
jgi:hypothetical protein